MIPRGVSVTLVEPRGPVNVGQVARALQNFGVERLYLVNPKADISVAAVYASHASHILDRAVVTTFREVRRQNELLVATTAVKARKRSNVIRRAVSPDALHDLLSASRTSSLVFGRDTTGLTNEEIKMCDVTTTVDTAPGHRALNIGHAAAIILYLASHGRSSRPRTQSRRAREVFARTLSELGGASREPPQRTRTLFEVGKRIAAASKLNDVQLHTLSGVLRKALVTIEDLQDLDSKT